MSTPDHKFTIESSFGPGGQFSCGDISRKDDGADREQSDANQSLLMEVLRIFNRSDALHPLIAETLRVIRERTGFEAVGLRLRQGDDYPYFEYNGFEESFVRREDSVCARDTMGAILRKEGRAVLECTCGAVLSGQTDPELSCFTENGSFWTNDSRDLLTLGADEDPRFHARNHCIYKGYQSIGLFPLRAGEEVVGLLQLNDKRPGRFTMEQVAFYEALAQNIGLAVQRTAAQEALREANEQLEQRVRERTAELEGAMSMLQVERQRFQDVLDQLPAYLVLLGPDHHVPFANRFFEERFGPSRGKRCYEYLFNRSEPCENCQSFEPFKTGRPHHWEWNGPDGRCYDIYDYPFTDVDGSPLIIEVGLDITDRKEAEAELAGYREHLEQLVKVRTAQLEEEIREREEAEEKLRRLNESLEQRVFERTAQIQAQADQLRTQADQLRALASQLSQAEQRERKRLAKILHDHIQQIIVAARMQVSWMQRGQDVEQMQATAKEVAEILREALDASRSLAVDLSPPVLHEAGLAAGLRWLASDMQKKNQFCVRLLADPTAEPVAEETRSLLFECVRELLFNSIKHAGVSEAHVSLERMTGQIRVIVSDEGRGFDPQLLKNRRADEVSFGLFSIQERLRHIAGQMEIETAPGRGSRIVLTIPADETPAARTLEERSASEEREETITVRLRADLRRVLIVDDHKIMREGLKRLLRFEADLEVVGEAEDGFQAVAMTDELEPDVVIMDVNLGEMGGVEATRRILAKRPQVRVIGLSMHADDDVARAMREAGAAAYLTKSGPSRELIAAIRGETGSSKKA
jgi:signal transduction histidine kinase/ActR/RegA family two-component response regulator